MPPTGVEKPSRARAGAMTPTLLNSCRRQFLFAVAVISGSPPLLYAAAAVLPGQRALIGGTCAVPWPGSSPCSTAAVSA